MQHCSGVNALHISPDGKHLWTASRDSVIKEWDVASGNPRLVRNLEGHVDWVNDITLLPGDSRFLVSCSSDGTLRVWDTLVEGRDFSEDQTMRPLAAANSLACLSAHTDYVTSLSASRTSNIVVSGGLGGEIFLWDLKIGSAYSSPSIARAQIDEAKGSVYSVALDSEGRIAVAGAATGSIFLIDARAARAQLELHGHTGNVRALCLRRDAGLLVSGSSDHTLRVWDLRQSRSLQTLAVHTDSVWCVRAVSEDLSSVVSGGRDGRVYLNHLSSRRCECLIEESAPITSLASNHAWQQARHHSSPDAEISVPNSTTRAIHLESLWVSTTQTSVNRWKVGKQDVASNENKSQVVDLRRGSLTRGEPSRGVGGGSEFIAGSLPALRARISFQDGEVHPHPKCCEKDMVVPGASPIVKVAVLTDRRHVLTEDADEDILLWDLTMGRPVKSLGKVGLKNAERELFDPAQCVSPWFQPDTRLGCLAGVMKFPECFSAEAYRRDLGDNEALPDAKVNMAAEMLKALFGTWAENLKRLDDQSAGDGDDEELTSDNKGPEVESVFDMQCEVPPIVMVSGIPQISTAQPWRKTLEGFDGTEVEGEIIPQWVADCVLRGAYPAGRQLKMAFSLVPMAGSGLPALLQSKLNAPRVLTIDKVADYILRKMADQRIHLIEQPLFWCPEKQATWEANHGDENAILQQATHDPCGNYEEENHVPASNFSNSVSRGYLDGLAAGIKSFRPIGGDKAPGTGSKASSKVSSEEKLPLLITCGDAAVPWDFTLAAVRQWMWKRSEDLKLEYGILKPGMRLQPPAIRPPA